MASWGIGLGGLADGLSQGVGLGDKLNKMAQERQARDTYDSAIASGKQDFNDAVARGDADPNDVPASLRFAAPHVMAAMVQNRDLQGLKQFSDWSASDEARQGSKLFESGVRRVVVGDVEGGWGDFQKLGQLKGYGGNYQIGPLQKQEDGTFVSSITTPDGNSINKSFANPQDVMKFMTNYGNPATAFEDLQTQQKRQAAVTDDATKYKARTDIDTGAEAARVPIDTEKYQGRKNVDVAAKRETVPLEVDEYGQKKRIDEGFDALKGDRDVANDATKYGARKKIDASDREGATTDALERYQGQKQIDLSVERQKNDLGLNGTREHDPADVKTAQWLIDKKIAKDPADAWNLVRRSRDNPDQIRATIFSRAISPTIGQKNWEAYLKAGQQPATPAPGITGNPPAQPAPRPAAQRPDQMSPGNGNKPVASAIPTMPATVPPGSGYSPSTGLWFTRDGRRFDKDGNAVAAQ